MWPFGALVLSFTNRPKLQRPDFGLAIEPWRRSAGASSDAEFLGCMIWVPMGICRGVALRVQGFQAEG